MFGGLRRVITAFVLFALFLLAPLPSHAFCGFYVNTGEAPLYNEATRVAMMRAGTRTVLSIQNDYAGPLEDFALVIPVPIILERENVKTLPHTLFDRIDKLSSPRLVEYWEKDPCDHPRDEAMDYDSKEGGTGTRAKGEEGSMGNPIKPLVIVEREFKVDEYDVVILSALDSGALETWLHQNNYKIPKGAEPYFRPYIQDGSKFFVAKVDIKRVKMRWNRAELSPLRFHYDTPEFKLPIRLGLINSNGQQDLLVYILGEQRYETANYENLFIPTNLQLTDETRTKFNRFYGALFDKTVSQHKRAVVTEYSWSPEHCDPCPEGAGPIDPEDAQLLGLDVVKPVPSQLILTRLHARYGKDTVGDDLVFKTAPPVEGGREGSSHDAAESSQNNFQARYVIRHYYTGPLTCSDPRFDQWGGPDGTYSPPPKPNALNANRDLNVEDYIVDDKIEFRAGSKTPAVHGHAPSGQPSHLIARFRYFLDPAHWDGDFAVVGFSVISILSFGATLIWARRRRTGVPKTLGYYLLFAAVAAVIFAEALSPHDHLIGRYSSRYFGVEKLVVLATWIAIGGLAAGRTTLRASWALLPLVAGFVHTAQQKAFVASVLKTELSGAPLDQLSRIHAESASEASYGIIFGAAITAAFLVLVFVISGPRREGAKWAFAAGVFAIAAVARNLLLPRDGIELIALVVFAGAACLIVRARGFNVVLAAVTAVLLLDVAAKLYVTSRGLGAISSESVDPVQIRFILVDTIRAENRHLLIAALDLGLLGGLIALTKMPLGFIDWRLAAPAAVLVVIAATPFEWYGTRAAFESLDPHDPHNPILSGPTLFARGQELMATPSPEIAAQPYSTAVAEKMARAEAGNAPLLVVHSDFAFSTLLVALTPLLNARQFDYRFMETRDAPRELGSYGNLVAAHDSEAWVVDIMPKLDESGLRSANREILGVRVDDEQVSVKVLGGSFRKKFPRRGGTDYGWRSMASDLRSYRVVEAIVAAPVETPLATLNDVLAGIDELKYFPSRGVKILRVTISPDVTVLDKL